MTPSEVRSIIRRVVSDPKRARQAVAEVLRKFVESTPAVATTMGAYLLSDYLARRLKTGDKSPLPHPLLLYFEEPPVSSVAPPSVPAAPAIPPASSVAPPSVPTAPAVPQTTEPTTTKVGQDHSHARNTIGTLLEGKIHESFTVTADRLYQAGLMDRRERIGLSNVIGRVLEEFRRKAPKAVFGRPMNERAHELVKSALSHKAVQRALQARIIQYRLPVVGPAKRQRLLEDAARTVAAASPGPASPAERSVALKAIRMLKEVQPGKAGDIYRTIRSLERVSDAQGRLFP